MLSLAYPSRSGPTPGRRVRRAACLLAAVLAVLPVLAGCSGSEARAGAPPATSTSPAAPTAAPPPVATVHTRVTRVAGDLSTARREALARAAQRLVERYVQTAYVVRGGRMRSFPGFTPGARQQARHDSAVLTGRSLPAGRTVVPGRSSSAYVAALAPHGRAVGATARLSLDLRVGRPQGRSRPVTVTGRLLLTPTGHGWRIFGYDLALGGAHAAGGAR